MVMVRVRVVVGVAMRMSLVLVVVGTEVVGWGMCQVYFSLGVVTSIGLSCFQTGRAGARSAVLLMPYPGYLLPFPLQGAGAAPAASILNQGLCRQR